jgi:hypothetical protein
VGWLVVSTSVLGVDAWTGWMHKISLLAQGPHVNHVSLRALVSFSPDTTVAALAGAPPGTPSWSDLQMSVLRSRLWLYAGLITAFVLTVVSLARRQRLEHAALLGLLLVPVVFNPSNYYAHLVFLLPLLAMERRPATRAARRRNPVEWHGAIMWLVLLAVCVIQYATVLTPHLDLHFIYASVLMMMAIVAVLLLFARRDRERLRRKAARSRRRRGTASEGDEPVPSPERARFAAEAGGAADSADTAEASSTDADDIPAARAASRTRSEGKQRKR